MPYSPLGHGFLTGQIRTVDDIPDDDWRKTNPRFVGENFERNLRIVDEVEAVATEAGATPAQVALGLAPRPGRRHRSDPGHPASGTCRGEHGRRRGRAQPEQIERLNNLTPAAGDRHDEANMARIER